MGSSVCYMMVGQSLKGCVMPEDHSSREKLEAAQALIEQKRYEEARAILRTIDNVMALDLLDQINAIDPPKARRRYELPIIAAIVIVLVVVAILAYTQRQRIPFIVAL